MFRSFSVLFREVSYSTKEKEKHTIGELWHGCVNAEIKKWMLEMCKNYKRENYMRVLYKIYKSELKTPVQRSPQICYTLRETPCTCS